MKTNVRTGMEVLVTAPDELGVLSRISTTLAEARVNINAICAYEIDDVAHLRLLTDNNRRAVEALNKAGFETTENEVIISEVSPHAIHPDVAAFAGGYDIENNYWCASAHGREHALLVFSMKDSSKSGVLR